MDACSMIDSPIGGFLQMEAYWQQCDQKKGARFRENGPNLAPSVKFLLSCPTWAESKAKRDLKAPCFGPKPRHLWLPKAALRVTNRPFQSHCLLTIVIVALIISASEGEDRCPIYRTVWTDWRTDSVTRLLVRALTFVLLNGTSNPVVAKTKWK